MECADVLDVSNAERSDNLSNVVFRAETLRQCKLGFSADKMVGDNKVFTARCRWNGTSSVPAECQNRDNCVRNRCGSHRVCRVKATPTVVHLDDYTCECDSGFELKSTARVAAYPLPSTMLITCPRTPLSWRKLSPTSVMCSACRVSSVTAESRRKIFRTTSGARSREHCAMRAIRLQRTLSTDRQHQLSRRPCASRVQLEEELKLRTRPEEAYAEEFVRLTVRTRVLYFIQEQLLARTHRMKCSLLRGSRCSRCSSAMRRYRAQHRCHVLRSLKLSTVRSCRSRSFGEVL